MKVIDCLTEGNMELQGRDGEYFSMAEQERYESGIIEEARQIVAGKSLKLSTAEHLRVLLSWLDGSNAFEVADLNNDSPF